MMKMGRDVRWGVVAAAGVLLLGFIGCTTTLERTTGEQDASAALSKGFLSDYPTQPPDAAEVKIDAEAPAETELRVHEIAVDAKDGLGFLVVRLSRPPARVQHFILHDPERIVIDCSGPLPAASAMQTHPVGDGRVDRIRIGAHDGKLRIVADLSGPAPSDDVTSDDRSITAFLGAIDASGERLVYRAPGATPVAVAERTSAPMGLDAGDTPVAARADDAPAFAAASDHSGAEPIAAAPLDEPAPDSARVALASEPDPMPRQVDAMPPPAEVAAVAAEVPPAPADAVPAPPDPPAAAVGDLAKPAVPSRVAFDDDADPAPSSDERAPTAIQTRRAPVPVVTHEDRAPEAPVFEEPAAYALPVQAAAKTPKPKGVFKAPTDKKIVTPIDGGIIEQLPPRGPREYTGQRISLDFKDADVQNVLRILADVSGFNIITTEEVQGKLTMRLIDVPWDQAFDAILRAKNLDSVRDGNVIRVSTVEQLKKERDAQRAADEAQKQVEPLEVRYLKVNYAKADEKLVKKVQEVLTERGSATWDERTNTIVVRDIARGVADASELITKFDTQTPQVLIEANIVEATAEMIRDLGIQWGYTYKAGPEIGNAPGVNFPGRINSGGVLAGGKNSPATTVPFIADFPAAAVGPGAGTAYDILLGSLDGSLNLNARLTALENENKGKIISRPRVVTLNNVPAKIESLRILRVKLPSTGTVISTGAGGVAGASQAATEQIRTGITLQVTPQVSSDGFIFLDVYAKSSTLAPSSSPDQIPDEISREAESHVLIQNGETFVLGGVFRDDIQNADTGVPFLRSIPVLGWAFKNNRKDNKREELLVFVTPTAVRGRSDAQIASLPSAQDLWQNRPHP